MQPHDRSDGTAPKKPPKTTMFWIIVLTVGVAAWIALELVQRALS